MTDPVPSGGFPAPRRVDWIELLFDLAMVAVITQLAEILHHPAGPGPFLLLLLWSIPAWWAWTNVMVCINFLPLLPLRPVRLALLGAMATVCLMGASVGGTTDRAWAFALANRALRLVLLALWWYRARRDGASVPRTFVYNGLTALLWFGSALLPQPFMFLVWAVAILIEIALLPGAVPAPDQRARVDLAHAIERLGLFMMILIGESVLSLVTSLSAHWSGGGILTALLGFITIAVIAWDFFVSGITLFEAGVERLSQRRDAIGLLTTVMFLPYLIVVGITMLSAGLASVVSEPEEHPGLGVLICLDGGLALFSLASAMIALRYGAPVRRVLGSSIPAIVLCVAAVAIVRTPLTATAAAAVAAGIALLTFTVPILRGTTRREHLPVG